MLEENRSVGTRTVERPSGVAELSALVSDASRSERSLLLRGGGTHAAFANIGPEPDSVIDLTGLDAVIDYSPVDLTLAVGAGARLSAIDRLLAEHGQRLALDMPNRDRATIGGAFASGLSGPRRLRYGSLKDMVIGSEIVNHRGEVTKSGGMVVKNVSGYEISRLHYGAHGAFGVVSRLNLKVLPAPESRAEAVCRYDDPASCIEAAMTILVSSLDPAAVYAVRSAAGWNLSVQVEGSARFTAAQGERIVDHLSVVQEPHSADVIQLDGRSTPGFDKIADLLDAEHSLVARLSVPASNQSDFLRRLPFLESVEVLADLGSGLIYLRCNASQESLSRLDELDHPLVYLALPDSLRQGRDVFGVISETSGMVLSRLKDEYDPKRVFNPGRFVSFL
ncbi:FAD-binding oxidoreductase [soil metagenome]